MARARSSESAPLAGCRPLFGAAAMREADRLALQRHHMPSILLMERAGLAAADAILDRWPQAGAADVLVGAGNNGGDGMVVARHLVEAGWRVRVMAPGGRPPEAPDAAQMTRIAASMGIAVTPFDGAAARREGVAVDALLGTGAGGPPREAVAAAIAWIAAGEGPVVALDVPTGVEADSGRVPGAAVTADLTVTFHGDMTGLHVEPGRGHAGEVLVADIGVPSAVALGPDAWLAGPGAVAVLPRKTARGDKYAAGAVLVIAGAPGMVGAACLCASAALRAGAGLCVLATPARVQPLVAARMLEVMCPPLPDDDGALGPASVAEALAQSARAAAVALGPGIGRATTTTAAVEALLAGLERPLVLDADGLWHLGDAPERLAARPAPTVLTPHAGEAARLLGVAREEVEAGRLDAARELARRARAVVVLKGPGTLIADPAGTVVVAREGPSALASAGTGDVLTGAVAAALAGGLAPLAAAAAAVVLHARAGALAGRGDGTIASDVVDALPAARAAAGG